MNSLIDGFQSVTNIKELLSQVDGEGIKKVIIELSDISYKVENMTLYKKASYDKCEYKVFIPTDDFFSVFCEFIPSD